MTRQLELARKGQISSTPLELGPVYQEWKFFEFVTQKNGASGPTKTECLNYYAKKYVHYDGRKNANLWPIPLFNARKPKFRPRG